MAEFAIDLELSPALRALDDLRKKQIPFALASGLTATAKQAQQVIRSQLPERFTIRSPFIERGVRIQAATKRRQEAVVYWQGPQANSGRRFAESLARQETGGLKRPMNKALALPRNVRRGARGAIVKSQRPAAVLQRKRVFIQDVRGGAAIFQRTGKSSPPRLLYFLSPRTAKIDPRFEFRDTARKVAQRVFAREFGRAFGLAIATRRR